MSYLTWLRGNFLLWALGSALGCGENPVRAEAHQLVAEGAALVDVRTPSEFAAGHIDGAINVPLNELLRHTSEIGAHSRPVVVYCRSGARSAVAKSELEKAGYARVVDLGPMSRW